MSMSDPLGDMLTRIRNGQHARKASIESPASKLRESVLVVLQREGYIRGFERVTDEKGFGKIRIELKYVEGEPVIREISRVSTPGRRVYSGVKTLAKFYNGLGVQILSTPKGVMTDHDARAVHVGGEVLCSVF